MSEIDWEAHLGRPRCCDQDFGGSHYHCARCGAVTGMYGHWEGGRFDGDRFVTFEAHMCCPDDCAMPEAHR